MLEIGLGCDMDYGPGASIPVWKTLFQRADIWEAEYNRNCVKRNTEKLKGINVLTGNQGSTKVLD